MSLTFTGWQRFDQNHVKALAQAKIVSHTFAAGITTTSATYASLPVATSVSFTKLFAATALRIDFCTYPWVSVAVATELMFGVLINGVDYDVSHAWVNEASIRRLSSGVARVAAGLAAGTYTIQPRWRRVSGTGTGNLDTISRLYMLVTEVK